MKAFLDSRQRAHHPQHWMSNGRITPSPEVPQRIIILQQAAERVGCTFGPPHDAGPSPIAAVHTAEYLEFLETIFARWRALDDASEEVVPKIHPANRTDTYPHDPVGQAGFHQADTSCPIGPATWQSAYWSAQSAVAAADTALAGEEMVYALCRPPGHHAFCDLAGGFCFLNNAAIAAQRLNQAGKRVSIVDIDVHHGNGTQGIFYERSDVLTVSLHADPNSFYPFFWGHAHERGFSAGLGTNLNLPLRRGTGDRDYLDALNSALTRIKSFGTDIIVVALGLDAHESDPFNGLSVTTEGFARIGATLSATNIPLVLIQEGGYMSDELGTNLESFMTGLL